MTKPNQFAISGLLAGLLTTVGSARHPSILLIGAGPLFFLALLLGVLATGGRNRLSHWRWQFPTVFVIVLLGYILSLLAFAGVYGFAPQAFGIKASRDVTDFGLDVWLGLVAAIVVSSAILSLVTYVLNGTVDFQLTLCLIAMGTVASVASFLATIAGRAAGGSPILVGGIFVGVLLSLGEALYCRAIGSVILGRR